MNPLKTFERAAARLGYPAQAIKYDYEFDDFSSTQASLRRAPLAVFTQTPTSYRSAAFGVAEADESHAQDLATNSRSLGAPLFFVISKGRVSVWQVRGTGPALLRERVELGALDELFVRNQSAWSPDAIQRAKSIGKFNASYQLDFIDAGLLPAIEGHIHHKLDLLLNEMLTLIKKAQTKLDDRQVFQGVFRLLAAKILVDRDHASARRWNLDDVASVMAGIGQYYQLSNESKFVSSVNARYFASAWEKLRDTFSVANISAGDLAYVYEHTLVTKETRQDYSTHSTPRQVAELIAERLELWNPKNSNLKIFEPFTGAGVLLVAALRLMREALPASWNDKQRHEHLVAHLRGSEIDAFACEVATLSLILADYPNTNGWEIDNKDLFKGNTLENELRATQVVLCNPPFEPFTDDDKTKYPEVTSLKGNRAETVLRLALESKPQAIGFVLPRSFLMDGAYKWHRQEIEARYSHIEVFSLPDGIFSVSKSESALLIAKNPAKVGDRQTIISSEVDDLNRKKFLSHGEVTRSRSIERVITAGGNGAIWLTRLSPIWSYLANLPKLGDFVEAHWGIRWNEGRQSSSASDRKRRGHKFGLHKAKDHRQFVTGSPTWLDLTPENVFGAADLPWEKPKILCNAIRASRGAWRISAAVDRDELYASQQFVGIWPLESKHIDLDALAAIINSPLANAYMWDRSSDRRLRIATLKQLPIPRIIPPKLGGLARQYARLARECVEYDDRLKKAEIGGEAFHILPLFKTDDEPIRKSDAKLQELLDAIDVMVMDAYDLPPRMTKQLLLEFANRKRPVRHEWVSWNVDETGPALSLGELKSAWVEKSRGNWLEKELKPINGITEELASLLWG